MAELVADCTRCGADAITVDVKELNLVAEEHGWATTYEAFAVSCPHGRHLRLAGSHSLAVDMDRAGAVWPAKAKLINYINRLTSVSWHRDNGRDNNFLHVPMKCRR
jgi:hypothetical protein